MSWASFASPADKTRRAATCFRCSSTPATTKATPSTAVIATTSVPPATLATSTAPLGVPGEWVVRLAPLPLDDVSDGRLVTQRRAIVEAGLLATRADLWTTEAKGFEARRVIARTYETVDWPAK